jgi:hypothetical protein
VHKQGSTSTANIDDKRQAIGSAADTWPTHGLFQHRHATRAQPQHVSLTDITHYERQRELLPQVCASFGLDPNIDLVMEQLSKRPRIERACDVCRRKKSELLAKYIAAA